MTTKKILRYLGCLWFCLVDGGGGLRLWTPGVHFYSRYFKSWAPGAYRHDRFRDELVGRVSNKSSTALVGFEPGW